jgi:hypothetical protein
MRKTSTTQCNLENKASLIFIASTIVEQPESGVWLEVGWPIGRHATCGKWATSVSHDTPDPSARIPEGGYRDLSRLTWLQDDVPSDVTFFQNRCYHIYTLLAFV